MTKVFCTGLVAKKWIPQYKGSQYINKEICASVDSCFNTKRRCEQSKRNSLVLIQSETYKIAKLLSRASKEKNSQFCNFLVWYIHYRCL